MSTGDIVILLDEGLVRTEWIMARVIEAPVDEDGLVRKVKLLLSTTQLDQNGVSLKKRAIVERPVHKVIVLIQCPEN